MFIVLLLLLFPLAAYAIAAAIQFTVRLQRHDDPDSDSAPQEKRFLVRSTIVLTAAMYLCIPMLNQWRNTLHIKRALQPLPLVDMMREYQPAIYQQLVQEVESMGLDDANVQTALTNAARKLRLAWIRAVPYASTDAVMRYIRYRYDEANLLERQNDNACIGLGIPVLDILGKEDVEFMQKNAPYIKDAMIMVFKSADTRMLMNYLEQRYAGRQYGLILDSLNKSFGFDPMPYADYRGCRYQKAFYLRLLDYSDNDMSKIMRWSVLEMINAADSKELPGNYGNHQPPVSPAADGAGDEAAAVPEESAPAIKDQPAVETETASTETGINLPAASDAN